MKIESLKNRKRIIIIALIFLIGIFGISYAFFNYYKLSSNKQLITGDIYLTLNDKTDSISLSNIFPETKEKARSRTDNVLTFSISGINTVTDEDIYYEILLNEGEGREGKTRFKAEDLVFDLSEVINGEDKLLADAVSFDSIDKTKIWIDTIIRNTKQEINRTYKLRVWLNERVIISDTDPTADYSTSVYKNSYASVKISVNGDFNEKNIQYNYLLKKNTGYSFWSSNIHNEISKILQVNFVSMPTSEINSRYDAATIKDDVTDSINTGSVKAWLEIDPNDNTKYIMYVASEGITYFPADSSQMFNGFTNLTYINFENINTSRVENFSCMFLNCNKLVDMDLSKFDTSNALWFDWMFQYCNSISENVVTQIERFATNKLIGMAGMFNGATNITSIDLSGYDTSRVQSFSYLFQNCNSLKKVMLNNLNTESLNSMDAMFENCFNLESINLLSFDVSKVTDMKYMFAGCHKIKEIDLSNFSNTNSLTTIKAMFMDCWEVERIYINNLVTSNVTEMSHVFMNCYKLKSLDIRNFDTKNVTTMSCMFSSCYLLGNLDLSSFDISKVIVLDHMFYRCESLETLDIRQFVFSDSLKSSTNNYHELLIFSEKINKIIVKSASERDWILSLSTDYRSGHLNTNSFEIIA